MKLVFLALLLLLLLIPAGAGRFWKDPSFTDYPPSYRWLARGGFLLMHLMPGRAVKALSSDPAGWRLASLLDPGLKPGEYARRRLVNRLMILYAGALAAAAALFLYETAFPQQMPAGGRLEREAANGSEYTEDLTAQVGRQKEELTVTVTPRLYGEEERTALLEKAEAYIDETLPGDNSSLQDVQYNLYFAESYPGENISIEWECEDYNLIGQDGSLEDLSQTALPVRTSVTAVIRYAGYEKTCSRQITITGYARVPALSERLQEEILPRTLI